MTEEVILVNEKDEAIGSMEKMEAHKKGVLHRAFSVFIFNQQGEMLLQKRALHKYHSAGLWTNACCSHPRPGESTVNGAKRRLEEEMGMACEITHQHEFIYHVSFDNDLQEHEYDHVFVGITNTLPKINPSEVAEYKYIKLKDLKEDLSKNPIQYTEWFKIIMNKVQF